MRLNHHKNRQKKYLKILAILTHDDSTVMTPNPIGTAAAHRLNLLYVVPSARPNVPAK